MRRRKLVALCICTMSCILLLKWRGMDLKGGERDKGMPNGPQKLQYREMDFHLETKTDEHCIQTLPRQFYARDDMPIWIPPSDDLEKLTSDEIKCLYHRYVTTHQVFCSKIPQLGNSLSLINGWHICMDEPYKISPHSCVVYTIYDFPESSDFNQDVTRQLDCRVHSLNLNQSQIYVDPENSHIFDHILDEPDSPYWSTNNHGPTRKIPEKAIDLLILKTDTGRTRNFVQLNEMANVRQFAFVLKAPIKDESPEHYKDLLMTLRTLWLRGFRIYHWGREGGNKGCVDAKPRTRSADCYIIYMINLNMAIQSPSREEILSETGTVPMFPSEEVINMLPTAELPNIYYSYLQSIEYRCWEVIRLGKLGDGGWEVCHDEHIRPRYPCLVYSFGINNDYSFDDDVSVTYGCETHSFDPSMNTTSYRRSDRVWFHDIGLSGVSTNNGGKSENWKLRTLDQIVRSLNHTGKRIDILKMDIEWSEWSALPNMLQSGILDHVAQLYIEFHSHGKKTEELLTVRSLREHGFKIFWTANNPYCRMWKSHLGSRSSCNEVYFINTKLRDFELLMPWNFIVKLF